MKKIVFGPNDILHLLSAGSIKAVHRMQAELTFDPRGNIISIVAYPVDSNLVEISGIVDYRINGCPFPPDCTDIGFTMESTAATDCLKRIREQGASLNIL